MMEKAVDDNKEFLKYFFHYIDMLTSDPDYEQKKGPILMGIIDAFKTFKNYVFESEDVKKIIMDKMKEKIFGDVNLFNNLKKIILLRERDRKPRESGIKILKKLIKLSKESCKIALSLKLDIIVSFILEREYKHQQV